MWLMIAERSSLGFSTLPAGFTAGTGLLVLSDSFPVKTRGLSGSVGFFANDKLRLEGTAKFVLGRT
jgi:hypothetical protein